MTHRRLVAFLVVAGLVAFYVVAAAEHGRRVNTSKARADQSGYLWDAENVYANWHGRQPPTLIGERNRMPLYAGYLALFYRPALSDPEFFEVAKRANIGLSLLLLGLLGSIFLRALPLHAALNLLAVVAFGYFIFKAPYAQSELLFYALFFVSFLACWHLMKTDQRRSSVGLAASAGVLCGLTQLTKAAMLPFVAIVVTLLMARALIEGISPWRGGDRRTAIRDLVAAAALPAAFLLILSPYLLTSKRVFGHYFYNVNSTFYVWYDNWETASVGTRLHRDGVGWPDLPASELPGPVRYWHAHSTTAIAERVGAGLADIVDKSRRMFGYLPYLIVFLVALLVTIVTRPQVIVSIVRAQPWQAAFLGIYGTVYLLATAFYFPTSGTGTARFFLTHLAPLFFVLTALYTQSRLKTAKWPTWFGELTLAQFNWLISAMLALDLLLRVWPRLMTTYGGF